MHLNELSSGHLVIHSKGVKIIKKELIYCRLLLNKFKKTSGEQCVYTTIDNLVKTKTLGMVEFKDCSKLKYIWIGSRVEFCKTCTSFNVFIDSFKSRFRFIFINFCKKVFMYVKLETNLILFFNFSTNCNFTTTNILNFEDFFNTITAFQILCNYVLINDFKVWFIVARLFFINIRMNFWKRPIVFYIVASNSSVSNFCGINSLLISFQVILNVLFI